MESRREFFKKAGLVGGLGAAGALTLKKEYVKPVVRMLEPSAAYAQTPAINVAAAAWEFPVFNLAVLRGPVLQNTLTLTLDVPGASPPAVGSTFNASLSLTNLTELGSFWGTPVGIPPTETVTSDTIDDAAVTGEGGLVRFLLDMSPIFVGLPPGLPPTLNGATILPTGWGSFSLGLSTFILSAVPGDTCRVSITVDADPGVTTGVDAAAQVTPGGSFFPAQLVGTWFFEFLFESLPDQYVPPS